MKAFLAFVDATFRAQFLQAQKQSGGHREDYLMSNRMKQSKLHAVITAFVFFSLVEN